MPKLAQPLAALFLAVLFTGMAEAEPVPAQVIATAEQLGQTALSDRWGYTFLEGLTSDIGQRLAGTEAEERAAQWAMAQLKQAGFENVHLESFPMTVWERGTESAAIVKPAPQRLILTALGGSVATPPKGIEAEAVIFPTYAAMLAASAGSLKGKIAVVTQAMVKTPDGSGYGAANPIRRSGPSEAARRGAVAYLMRSLGTDSHRLAHTGALNYSDGVARIPAAALAAPDAEQLDRLAGKQPITIKLVLTPTEHAGQSFTVSGDVTGRERPDQIVLIGAHLDSWDLATGAIDDGAGDAIVAGAARLIAALPQHPKRTVRVALFGAEEMDYSGAAYAKAHGAEAAGIVLAAESDFGARAVYAVQLPPGAAKSEFGAAAGRILTPLHALLSREPALRGGSDIEELAAMGVPVMSPRQNGLDYFDIHHTADDTFDKVDPAELSQNIAVWAGLAYLAAESDIDFRALPKTP
jgi:Zn-dependent M28 family amino/carboxypeptidase